MTVPSVFELGREISPAEQPPCWLPWSAPSESERRCGRGSGSCSGSGLGRLADALDLELVIPSPSFRDGPRPRPPATPAGCYSDCSPASGRVQQGRLHSTKVIRPASWSSPCCLWAAGRRDGRSHERGRRRHPSYGAGTLMAIADHLNLTGRSPLIGPNAPEVGPRFPDMTEVWDADLRARLHAAADAEEVGSPRAYTRAFWARVTRHRPRSECSHARGRCRRHVNRARGCCARWAGMRVCGVSLVTNPGAGLSGGTLSHAEVLAAAEAAGPGLARVIARFVAACSVDCRARRCGGQRATPPEVESYARTSTCSSSSAVAVSSAGASGHGHDADLGRFVRGYGRRIGFWLRRQRFGLIVALAPAGEHLHRRGHHFGLPVARSAVVVHWRVCRRPSMATCWPLPRYWPQTCARRSRRPRCGIPRALCRCRGTRLSQRRTSRPMTRWPAIAAPDRGSVDQ